ncbi:MAG: outer membrane lipoprotein chaperone LolA [Betaproteobacteria bacterium]|jgi:outer membrane lipoprotein carrier protein|nr:outer membrane lipoprotein chaperone LolA [Burkholderiaceae bacterium]MCZ8110576.1 outer membrane lipoprotein chaperone LolA [Rubrivivax sp.]MCZ8174535.1 outer membrane lipoprotein chaperone LolA [Burkholderiaceae bacterium]
MKTAPVGRRALLLAASGLVLAPLARGQDAVERLRAFVRDTRSGQAQFTQTVTSPDGQRRRTSSGEFAFARPDRFRFVYRKPFEQTLVSDGRKVWLHDPDLNQVSSRALGQALASTPAALLAGGALEPAFSLSPEPSAEGLDWVRATPQARDGAFQWMRVGFRGNELAVIEVQDGFGQRTRLAFTRFEANVAVPPERFRFVVPPGADLVEQ